MFSKKSYPWPFNQYMVQSAAGIQSSNATISVSVELCVFSFWFFEVTMVNPLLIDIPPPLGTLMFGCTANDPQYTILLCRFRLHSGYVVCSLFIWYISLDEPKLAQSSLLDFLTLIVRNEMSVQVSSLARLVSNNIFPTRWWNSAACLVLSIVQYSSTFKIIAGAELDLVTPYYGSDLSKVPSM